MDDKTQSLADARELQKMGYAQELVREMGGFTNFAVSFSVISILTGGAQLFGYGLNWGGPLQMSLGWILVSIFTTTVALSMAELASAYPTAGALYHWATWLGGKRFGWYTACLNLIGIIGILAGVDYGLARLIVGTAGWPATRFNELLVYMGILFSHAWLNHRGVRLVGWLNAFSAWYHLIVTVVIVGLLAYVGFSQPFSFLLEFHRVEGHGGPYSFLVGLLLAQWILTGFDASAHVTEETLDPARTAPWGIFLAVAVSAVAGFFFLGALALAMPSLTAGLGYGDNAVAEVLIARLGNVGRAAMVAILGAAWLCGLATLTSASRMVYAFARDGAVPYSHLWSRVSPKHRTPDFAIWALAVLTLCLAASIAVYSAVLSVAVVAIYLSYGLALGAAFVARAQGRLKRGPWNLGRASRAVNAIALLWIAFITVLFVLPPNQSAGYALIVFLTALTLSSLYPSARPSARRSS